MKNFQQPRFFKKKSKIITINCFQAQKSSQSSTTRQEQELKSRPIKLIKEQIGVEMGKMKNSQGHTEVVAVRMGKQGRKIAL